MNDCKLGKSFKLKNRTQIKKLFDKGKWFVKFPLKMVILETENIDSSNFKFGVSVSKRNFKRAVDRNYVKRLMRESIRLNKNLIENKINPNTVFMIVYSSNQLPNLNTVNNCLIGILDNNFNK